MENGVEGPIPQLVNMAQLTCKRVVRSGIPLKLCLPARSAGDSKSRKKKLTFPRKELPAILPTEGYALRYLAQQLHDLRNMVVVLAISRS